MRAMSLLQASMRGLWTFGAFTAAMVLAFSIAISGPPTRSEINWLRTTALGLLSQLREERIESTPQNVQTPAQAAAGETELAVAGPPALSAEPEAAPLAQDEALLGGADTARVQSEPHSARPIPQADMRAHAEPNARPQRTAQAASSPTARARAARNVRATPLPAPASSARAKTPAQDQPDTRFSASRLSAPVADAAADADDGGYDDSRYDDELYADAPDYDDAEVAYDVYDEDRSSRDDDENWYRRRWR